MTTFEPIRADFQTPRTFGLLNVAYAAALMACGMCQNFLFSIPALIGAGSVSVKANATAQTPTSTSPTPATSPDLATRLERLEAATTDPHSREVIASLRRRQALDRAGPAAPTVALDRLIDPRIVGHLVLDLASGLVLNLLMLASGVGLLLARGWARWLAVATAWMKIARMGILALSMTLVAAPAAAGMLAAVGDGAGGPELARSVRSLLIGFSWGLLVLGSIYPALTIHFLRLPSVREAFRSVSK